MPTAVELPRMLLSIVELMSGERFPAFLGSVVNKLIALALGHPFRAGLLARRRARLYPSLAAIIRALNDLPKPAAGLRCIDAIRVDRRALQVVHLPAGEVGTAYVPLFALAVRGKDESAFACANQYPHLAHRSLLFVNCVRLIFLAKLYTVILLNGIGATLAGTLQALIGTQTSIPPIPVRESNSSE